MARQKDMIWVRVKKTITLQQRDKEQVQRIVTDAIEKSTKIKENLSRIVIRAGRVYVCKLFEPAHIEGEGISFTQPLIDGKYLEYPFLRISIYSRGYTDCTLDFQRHNDQWMTIDHGTLEECIAKAEASEWFD
jgi:hypothetical protein